MYTINQKIERCNIAIFDSFEKVSDSLKIKLKQLELENFEELGYHNKVSLSWPQITIDGIYDELFIENKSGKILPYNGDVFLTEFIKCESNGLNILIEIKAWQNDSHYDENDNSDFIVWKINAKHFKLEFDRFVYY
jgi:hypothetical protein